MRNAFLSAQRSRLDIQLIQATRLKMLKVADQLRGLARQQTPALAKTIRSRAQRLQLGLSRSQLLAQSRSFFRRSLGLGNSLLARRLQLDLLRRKAIVLAQPLIALRLRSHTLLLDR